MTDDNFYMVQTEHTTYPKGLYSYAFPTEDAARKFAYRAVLAPGVVHARALDPRGVLVVEFSETGHKHEHSWSPSKTGYQNRPTCANADCPDC